MVMQLVFPKGVQNLRSVSLRTFYCSPGFRELLHFNLFGFRYRIRDFVSGGPVLNRLIIVRRGGEDGNLKNAG